MQITLSKAAFEHSRDFLAIEPFNLDEKMFRWNDNKLRVNLCQYEVKDLELLRAGLTGNPARGVKAAIRDINTWINAVSKDGDLPRARKVEHGTSLLRTFLARYPKHHVYTVNGEGEESVVLCFYVEEVTYHPPVKGDRHSHASPEYLQIDLAYKLFGTIKTTSRTLYYQDVIGKTPEQILAAAELFVETPELRATYNESHAKYEELFDKVGLQLEAVGYADKSFVDNDDEEYRWRDSGRWKLNATGQPARVLVDVFRESDKERHVRDAHVNRYFWSTAIKWADGVAELDDDADTEEFNEPDIPVHPYLVCFDLRKHSRIRIHVSNVTPYQYNTALRASLSLPEEHGVLIDTLLANRDSAFRDIIKNKTGGTIVLLQGSPGTGKTLTAEIYAEALCRPLYSVQCSQLGIDLADVEKNLMKSLARGRRWDAVMLLDEADVYVTKRGTDLVQNAIVGIFLRVLEYQAGVLFLTTNRGDLVDDAILSRCTAQIKYKKPSQDAQRLIWKNLCAANGVEIDDPALNQIVIDHNLSGRDIKNILKLCIAIRTDQGRPFDTTLVAYAKKFKPTCE